MQSHHAVLGALENDQQRSRDRWKYSEDEEEEPLCCVLPSLRASTQRLLNVRRVARPGLFHSTGSVGLNNLDLTLRFQEPLVPGEQDFIGQVLNSSHLMRKTNDLLQPFLQVTSRVIGDAAITGSAGGAKPGSATELACEAAQVIHQAKVCTARLVFKEIVEPLRKASKQAKDKYDQLWKQYGSVRDEYLREVAMLREQSRVRADPELVLDGKWFDVACFLDPVHMLSPEEMDFALRVVSEKLKMIFETNPAVTQTVDFGQVKRLATIMESREVQKLKGALDKKVHEITALQKQLYNESVQRRRSSNSGPSSPARDDGRRDDAKDIMVVSLQNLVSQLHAQQLNAEQERDALAHERDQLAKTLEEGKHLHHTASSPCVLSEESDIEQTGSALASQESSPMAHPRRTRRVSNSDQHLQKNLTSKRVPTKASSRRASKNTSTVASTTDHDAFLAERKRSNELVENFECERKRFQQSVNNLERERDALAHERDQLAKHLQESNHLHHTASSPCSCSEQRDNEQTGGELASQELHPRSPSKNVFVVAATTDDGASKNERRRCNESVGSFECERIPGSFRAASESMCEPPEIPSVSNAKGAFEPAAVGNIRESSVADQHGETVCSPVGNSADAHPPHRDAKSDSHDDASLPLLKRPTSGRSLSARESAGRHPAKHAAPRQSVKKSFVSVSAEKAGWEKVANPTG